MDARIDVITLGVTDLDGALAFYRDGLGLESEGVIGTEWLGDETTPAGATALFKLKGGLLLSLYPRTELAKDADVPLGPPKPGEFSIGHLVSSKAEVDALLARAQAAGASLTDQPHDRPWGIYSGYFRDPDGHLWEIIWNPRMLPRSWPQPGLHGPRRVQCYRPAGSRARSQSARSAYHHDTYIWDARVALAYADRLVGDARCRGTGVGCNRVAERPQRHRA